MVIKGPTIITVSTAAGSGKERSHEGAKTPPRPPALAGTRRRLSVCQLMESVILLNGNRGTTAANSADSADSADALRLEGCKSAERRLLNFVRSYPKEGRTMLLYGASGSAFIYLAKQIAKENPRWDVHYVRMKQFLGRCSGRDCQRELESLFTRGKGCVKLIFFYLLDTIYASTLAPEEMEYANQFRGELPIYLKRAATIQGLAVVASAKKPWLFPKELQELFQKWAYVGLPGAAERIRLIKAHIGQIPCAVRDFNFQQLARMTEEYTFSEVGNLVEEAHLGPFKRIEAATHFRRVDDHWQPCSSAQRGAVELSWHTMKPTDIKEPMNYDDLLDGFVKVERRRTDKELGELLALQNDHPESQED
ncbi:hypothetical protein HPB48_022060 [Haemaphysalis longicornis]|uniref:Uncharacterized protein n=1 Tax=Haemaphysalis longicornis TaxID=44386 RepID=A0A9J6GY55_HAELO|nr:hypothetical protein HPB48_022060 [Haemaphysalis longicornis]